MKHCYYSGEFDDVLFVKSEVYNDTRGWFKETWTKGNGITKDIQFVKDNVSKSNKGVLRGLHFQLHNPQGKLVTVLNGAVIDVIIDIRKDSPTFLKAEHFLLTEDNGYQLYVPPGFAHGFLSLEDNTIFQYKCTAHYCPTDEYTLKWDNNITNELWYKHPRDFHNIIVSEKDNQGISIQQLQGML